MARHHAGTAVADLGDADRIDRFLSVAVDAGLLGLRDDDGRGPVATGVEAAIVATGLAGRASEVPYLGRILAADLARRADAGSIGTATTLGLGASLCELATSGSPGGIVAIDAHRADRALVLVRDGDKLGLGSQRVSDAALRTDLTRPVGQVAGPVSEIAAPGTLESDALRRWRAFGHALLAADMLGSMTAAHELAVEYAMERRQYGRPIGSFQAVQHLLAESLVLCEGARSIVDYASWAADEADLPQAIEAGLVAKIYVGSAARTVCENSIQVHGGIGNTWECMVHVHLRRVLVSGDVLGSDALLLGELAHLRRGADRGLS